jgi:hypothetical protein
MLVDVRTRLAKFINAPDVDDVVLVPNTSHGINVVFHNIDWQPDDILIGCEFVLPLLHTVSLSIYSSFLSAFSDAFVDLFQSQQPMNRFSLRYTAMLTSTPE